MAFDSNESTESEGEEKPAPEKKKPADEQSEKIRSASKELDSPPPGGEDPSRDPGDGDDDPVEPPPPGRKSEGELNEDPENLLDPQGDKSVDKSVVDEMGADEDLETEREQGGEAGDAKEGKSMEQISISIRRAGTSMEIKA